MLICYLLHLSHYYHMLPKSFPYPAVIFFKRCLQHSIYTISTLSIPLSSHAFILTVLLPIITVAGNLIISIKNVKIVLFGRSYSYGGRTIFWNVGSNRINIICFKWFLSRGFA